MGGRTKRTPKKPAKLEDAGVDSEDEVLDEESEEEQPKKKRKTAAKKPKKEAAGEPEGLPEGWAVHPPSLLYKGLGGASSSQIAAFDLDGTLALQKSALQFPRDADDWVLYNKSVPDKLRELQAEGFKLVIFSNQGGIKSATTGKMAQKVTKRVDNILGAIGLDLPVLLASNKDDFRKPETGMWTYFVEHGNSGTQPDKSKSFFVGDAAGNAGDFADSDKKFAENVGIGFKTSKEFFGEPEGKVKPGLKGSSGQNDEMAAAFRAYAALQEEQGANAFGVRAIQKAADTIESHPTKIKSGKEMSSYQGIGKGTVAKIDEFLATGTLSGLKKEEKGPAGEAKPSAAAEMAMKFV